MTQINTAMLRPFLEQWCVLHGEALGMVEEVIHTFRSIDRSISIVRPTLNITCTPIVEMMNKKIFVLKTLFQGERNL